MPEENKRRVRRFWEHLFDERGWSVVGDIVSPEVVFRGTLGKEVRGIEGLTATSIRVDPGVSLWE